MEIGLREGCNGLDYGVTNMKKLTVLTGLVLAAWAGAKVCDQTYHLQEAYQYTLTGTTAVAAALKAGATVKLDKPMGNATLLHDSTEYRMITDFDAKGTCDAWVKREVTFATRKKAAKTWSSLPTMDYSIKFNDNAFTHKLPGWDEYWFGLASSVTGETVALWDAVGKYKKNPLMTMWYGNAIMKLTTRTKNGALVGTSTGFFSETPSHSDSATLATVLLNGWKSTVPADTQTIEFTVQLIKMTYDSIPTPVTRVAAGKAKASGFQASQTGNLVLIKVGDKAAGSEPLSLYGMMGNKIATLHPTGYYYQWNGKTAQGADASPGVYFVQAGNRILGKFFFSR
jgi:hypothetical protein